MLAAPIHIRGMDFDISHLLDQWDYQPGQVVVRRFKGKDGKEISFDKGETYVAPPKPSKPGPEPTADETPPVF